MSLVVLCVYVFIYIKTNVKKGPSNDVTCWYHQNSNFCETSSSVQRTLLMLKPYSDLDAIAFEFHQWCLFEAASNIIIKQWYKRSTWRSRRFQWELKGRCYTFCNFLRVSPKSATPKFTNISMIAKPHLWRKNTIIDNQSHSSAVGIISLHLRLTWISG